MVTITTWIESEEVLDLKSLFVDVFRRSSGDVNQLRSKPTTSCFPAKFINRFEIP